MKLRLPYDPGPKPLPKRPYRDSAVLYGALAAVVVIIGLATGGDVVRVLVVAVVFFLFATAWSWWRFREKLGEGRRR